VEIGFARAAADRARPAGAGARPRIGAAQRATSRRRAGARRAAAHPAPGPEGRRGADRLEPRALHPHAAQGQRDRDPAAGERPGHGARADRSAPPRAPGSRTAPGNADRDTSTSTTT
jgi:hypothetical protein